MSTLVEVRAAEEAMRNARAACLEHAVGPRGKDFETTQRRLLTELGLATDRYFQLVLELKVK